jgi:cytoskeletal protein CcmA (bactofilin family)
MEDNNKQPRDDDNSLETPETQLSGIDSTTTPQPIIEPIENLDSNVNEQASSNIVLKKQNKTLGQKIRGAISSINIYLLLFIVLLILSGIVAFISYRASKKTALQGSLFSQTLSAKDLQNLKNNSTTVGDSSQVLTVASNSIFNGQMLIKNDLNVAGTIRVGGALNLPGITVSGTSNFQNVQVGNSLNVAGDAGVQGTLTVQKNLSISGSAAIAGTLSAASLNVDQLTLNKNLQVNRHISVGGPIPKVTSGSNLGSGGTVSISGSDTAGTININFGNSPSAGYLANIVFGAAFDQVPHIVITPVGSNCSTIGYYITRSTNGFSIGATNPASGSCSFDFIAID